MPKSALRVALLGLVAAVAALPAHAACEYPHSHTTTYSAYIEDAPPNYFWACSEIVISPMHAHHWDVIGETTVDCDGNVSSWGDTTSCTGSANVTRTSESCPPVCQ